jgi:microcystin-dependent protein
LSAAYPVGSIYINATSASNPSTLLGFGTWTAFGAGRVLVGLDAGDALFDTAEETGGSKDAVVVSHTHTASSSVSDPGHSHGIVVDDDTAASGGSYFKADNQASTTNQTNSASTGISVATTVNSTGSSGTNANVQPYITVRMWKRTA